jgi:putative tricarboxylic transport membrane protein
MEQYFLRALKESNGDIMVLFSSTLGNVLWVALIISLFMPTILAKWRARGGATDVAFESKS